MEGWVKGFKDFIRDVAGSQGFSSGYFLETIVKHFRGEVLRYCGVVRACFSMMNMLWLCNGYLRIAALICCRMICGVITSVEGGLLCI